MTHYPHPEFSLTSTAHPQRTLLLVKRLAWALLCLLLLAGGGRLAIKQSEATGLRQATAASLQRSVIGVRPRLDEGTQKIVLPASLRGYTEASINARGNGYLKAWHKNIGDHVKKGELLAEIDVPELEQELAQAHAAVAQVKARLELARSTLQRWSVLNDSDAAVQQEFDEKRSAFLQAEADLAAAEANVKRLQNIEGYRRITAPFAGVITRRAVDVGSLITAGGQELFALTQTDPLRLGVWVPQAYADDVKSGQTVTLTLTDKPNKSITTRIERVAGALDPVNRTRQAEILLPNSGGQILPGAYAEVTIKIEKHGAALVVPVNVLVLDKDGARVVVVDVENKIAFRPVKLGRDFGREVEILEGIGADDVLVASPSDLLVEGETVSVVEVKTKSASKENAPAKAKAG
ncbi:efflux RND transporter periplasmic adaptor subunit [Methylomonas sp. SURF-2]|uniref:Efflux RND transporter periplasmic adaptor subunit n=1 Tax=Methylomonas subterranea TaxID=2952225 RepID=A0ABT1TL78_9GAMM|nr:efflux RND transporter periplasmic adaptor subunit [Methylomonas sp. SURF-2]MCQ8106215.1 efflux RND transporter periplasmic adaptor subunit [Methylomonas sp. SURF-2]